MLGLRVVTAAVLAAILVPGILFGGVEGVALFVAAFAGVAVWELSRNLSELKSWTGLVLTLSFGLLIVAAFYFLPPAGAFAVVVWFPLAVLAMHLFLYHVITRTIESVTQMVFVVAYAAIPLAHAIPLARQEAGIAWVFFVLVVASIADAGAYFAGKYYGKHHFSKHVSPRKTVEGLAGGLAGGVAGMLAMKLIATGLPSLGMLLPLTILLVALDVIGDLSASAIKRRLGIKDFGFVLPGHGGVLDRADALILAFPATYHFVIFCTQVGSP